jgi:hypothetical protein
MMRPCSLLTWLGSEEYSCSVGMVGQAKERVQEDERIDGKYSSCNKI